MIIIIIIIIIIFRIMKTIYIHVTLHDDKCEEYEKIPFDWFMFPSFTVVSLN